MPESTVIEAYFKPDDMHICVAVFVPGDQFDAR